MLLGLFYKKMCQTNTKEIWKAGTVSRDCPNGLGIYITAEEGLNVSPVPEGKDRKWVLYM